MAVSKFVVSSVSWVESRVVNLSFRTDSKQDNTFPETKSLNASSETGVNDEGACVKRSSANSSHSLARSFRLGSCKDNHRSWLNKLKSVTHFADSEVLILRVVNSYKLGRLAVRDHHIVQGPAFFFCFLFLVVGNKCLPKVILVLLVVHWSHAFFLAVFH
jgi:hypothetical protein